MPFRVAEIIFAESGWLAAKTQAKIIPL